jgi:hypothetical protein
MGNREILLSAGTLPLFGLERASNYAQGVEFDGLEVLPLRQIVRQVKKAIRKYGSDWPNYLPGLTNTQSLHQSWRLDSMLESEHDLNPSIKNRSIRLLFFPGIDDSREVMAILSENRQAPVVIHDISSAWTKDSHGQDFAGGLLLEISSHQTRKPEEIRNWLEENNHYMVVDTRDDQSIVWANKHEFKSWQEYWFWLGLEKIRSVQLTLIGPEGMNKIINHQETLAEQQLLWLNRQNWQGPITVEINPLNLLTATRGRFGRGLLEISAFVRRTLNEGKTWSR